MSMNVSISNSLEQFVQEQVKTGMYNSASEVVRAGLRLLREREINRRIAVSLRQLENGEYEEMNDEFWEKFESEIVSEIKNKNKK